MVSAGTGSPDPAAALQHLAASTSSLLRALDGLTDDQVRAASALPGWTRGHVLTHLSRNADGMGNLVTWAVSGVRTPMYPSAEARNADIEAGAGRPARELVADVAGSADRLAGALTALVAAGPEALARSVVFGTAQGPGRPAHRIASHRRREVEVHRADLDLDYRPQDWPADFVRQTLDDVSGHPRGVAEAGIAALVSDDGTRWPLATRAGTTTELIGSPSSLAAWLLGRTPPAALSTSDASPVPPPPPF